MAFFGMALPLGLRLDGGADGWPVAVAVGMVMLATAQGWTVRWPSARAAFSRPPPLPHVAA